MAEQEHRSAKPPDLPDIERRLVFHRTQLIGVPLLLLIPLLGALGVFGETTREGRASGDGFDAEVVYTARTRLNVPGRVEITVRATAGDPDGTLSVELPASYLEAFEGVRMTPEPAEVTSTSVRFDLPPLAPGDSRRIDIELAGDRYGRHLAEVRVRRGDAAVASVPISTFVFP